MLLIKPFLKISQATIRAFSLLICLSLLSLSVFADNALRVGVYQNPPSVFYDAQGKVKGFYIEILEYVANVEGWQLSYVKDTWPKLIENKYFKVSIIRQVARSLQISIDDEDNPQKKVEGGLQ